MVSIGARGIWCRNRSGFFISIGGFRQFVITKNMWLCFYEKETHLALKNWLVKEHFVMQHYEFILRSIGTIDIYNISIGCFVNKFPYRWLLIMLIYKSKWMIRAKWVYNMGLVDQAWRCSIRVSVYLNVGFCIFACIKLKNTIF